MIGYLVAYGCGVLSMVLVWQFVSLRRAAAEYRAEEEAYQKRAAARRAAMSPLNLYRGGQWLDPYGVASIPPPAASPPPPPPPPAGGPKP